MNKRTALMLPLWMSPLLALGACSQAQPPAEKPPVSSQGSEGATYPIRSNATLTYWLQSPTTLKASIQEVPFYQEWQRRVGVPVKFSEVSSAQAKESFSVLLSSGNLPDIIEYNWLKDVPGGPEKALKDGYILRLNDLIDSHAPNLKKYLKEHPDLDRLVKTDKGDYYAFPFLREGGLTTQWAGPVLRKDWLDELKLEVPQTIEEWHTVLTAFKEKKGAKAPLTIINQPNALQGFLDGAFIGAFGVIRDFYVDSGGRVQYGPLQPGYKQFLTTMNQWYQEGLLDANFTQTDRKALDANMTSGASGASVYTGATIDKWELALKAKDPAAKLVFAPYPVLKKGDTPMFGQEDWMYGASAAAAVSAKSKHPELAVQALDYAYSDEGYLLFNYGTEGKTYTLENGKPVLTDFIKNNPDKLSYVEALALHTHTVNPGPFVVAKDVIGAVAVQNEDHNYKVWKTDNLKHLLPPVTVPTEESQEFARIMADIHTLVDETSLKLVLGKESPGGYDGFLQKLNALNIKRAIEIQQAAYDRFRQR
ncbi:extracellular solute-binding protein [Paenibacillus filicis]|uniref:Extracellular solute-binding protein n=1 Tax=Paenibacillus filicis TaxID=669464 RepID=A0ABU9DS64_9BACL